MIGDSFQQMNIHYQNKEDPKVRHEREAIIQHIEVESSKAQNDLNPPREWRFVYHRKKLLLMIHLKVLLLELSLEIISIIVHLVCKLNQRTLKKTEFNEFWILAM